jgi:hypothetical protein
MIASLFDRGITARRRLKIEPSDMRGLVRNLDERGWEEQDDGYDLDQTAAIIGNRHKV